MKPRLYLHDLTVRLAAGAPPLLAGLELAVAPGEVVGICGRSGCGKTSLLAAIAGLLPWVRGGQVRGTILLDGDEVADLDPAQRAPHVSTCLDRPEAQLFLATPAQELAAAARRHGRPPLPAVVEALCVTRLLERRSVELSSGERQRVGLATCLAQAPSLALLDEPCTHLDPQGIEGLRAALAAARAAGSSVVLAEQAPWRLGAVVNRWLELRDGTLAPIPTPAPPSLPSPTHAPGAPVLAVRALGFSRGGQELLGGAELHLREGEIVTLSGPNGSGKSSLARVLVGHAASAGIKLSRDTRFLCRPPFTALAMPAAELQLFAPTVAQELALAGLPLAHAGELLRRHRLETLAARAPWTLSRGERCRLLHAVLDALEPAVVVVDEPAQGLDPGDLEEFATSVLEQAAAGRSYLLLSHRYELATLAHRRLRLERGRVVEGP